MVINLYEKILIPTDFSKHSEKLVDCIGDIPGLKEAVLLNVVARDPLARTWSPESEVRDAAKKLEKEKNRLEKLGLKVKVRAEPALEGEVGGIIKRVGDEEGASLVAMGARGRSILSGMLLGSVPQDELRYGDKDLLIMRYKSLDKKEGEVLEMFCTRLFTKVLLPIDFSEAGMAALNVIKANKVGDEVVLLHVVTRAENEQELQSKMQTAEKKLTAIKDELVSAGIKASFRVLKAHRGEDRTYGTGGMAAVKPPMIAGGAAEKIISAAEDENVSIIAMSSHGEGWVEKLLIGSVVWDVARIGTRPVLVIRSKMKA
ncbi:Universal stress protein [uncultured archaeon]|nr:Universal stress protein [uncultured archaeon]